MSEQHIVLLDYALSCFKIPPCLYVDEGIAAAINYGYYNDKTSTEDYSRNILFVNCDSDQLSIFLVHYERHKMSMINVWYSGKMGSRFATKVFMDLVLEKAVDDDQLDEDQVEEVRTTPFLKLKLINDLRKSYDMLSAMDCETTYVSVTDILPDVDVTVELTTDEFDNKVTPVFEEGVNALFNEVTSVRDREK